MPSIPARNAGAYGRRPFATKTVPRTLNASAAATTGATTGRIPPEVRPAPQPGPARRIGVRRARCVERRALPNACPHLILERHRRAPLFCAPGVPFPRGSGDAGAPEGTPKDDGIRRAAVSRFPGSGAIGAVGGAAAGGIAKKRAARDESRAGAGAAAVVVSRSVDAAAPPLESGSRSHTCTADTRYRTAAGRPIRRRARRWRPPPYRPTGRSRPRWPPRCRGSQRRHRSPPPARPRGPSRGPRRRPCFD